LAGEFLLSNSHGRSLLTQRPSKGLDKQRDRLRSEIDAVPFVALFWTLFFVVMVAKTTYTDLPTYAVTLVDSTRSTPMPGALREDVMQVNLTASGALYFDHRRSDTLHLDDQIRTALQAGSERKVYLWIDGSTKYGDVAIILREVRLAGIENVSFITR
jgi:biopolymer transport protein ExbD